MLLRRRPTGLIASAVGATVRLTGIDIGAAERLRLAQLGLRPGALFTILARTSGGGRLIALGTSRIALDRSTARRLAVEAA